MSHESFGAKSSVGASVSAMPQPVLPCTAASAGRKSYEMRMFLQGNAAKRDAFLFYQLIHAKKTKSTSAMASTMGRRKQRASNNAGEIHIRHAAFVFDPVITVLLRAPVFIAQGAVDDHDGEEGGVEVRHWRIEAASETPARGHDPVGEVVRLAGKAVPVRRVTSMRSREESVT